LVIEKWGAHDAAEDGDAIANDEYYFRWGGNPSVTGLLNVGSISSISVLASARLSGDVSMANRIDYIYQRDTHSWLAYLSC
jgi:hypothetical protein